MLPQRKHLVFDSREIVPADRLEVKFDKPANFGSTWSHTVAPKRDTWTLKPHLMSALDMKYQTKLHQ